MLAAPKQPAKSTESPLSYYQSEITASVVGAIANKMYSRTDEAAIADARTKLKVEVHGPRTWLLRLPFVNIAVFETDAGLVLVDSGYAPAGPALRETLQKLSAKPVHTIIHSHYHADHAWG
ncbi:MAG: MBL fold metallo-hydrolase, partial [Pseudanabaena sp. ELA748]